MGAPDEKVEAAIRNGEITDRVRGVTLRVSARSAGACSRPKAWRSLLRERQWVRLFVSRYQAIHRKL